MAKPAARRLLDVVKKKRRKQIVSKLLPVPLGKLGTLTRKRTSQEHQASVQDPLALTCLVQAKDVALFDKLGDGSFGVVRRGEWTTVIVSAVWENGKLTHEKAKHFCQINSLVTLLAFTNFFPKKCESKFP